MPELQSLTFWRQTLLYAQKAQGDTTTQCIKTFDGLVALYADMKPSLGNAKLYYEQLRQKGQGAGSNLGLFFNDMQQYIDLYIYGVNVFNYCDIDYYLRAVSKWFSFSGGMNQVVNLGWRALSTKEMPLFYDMSLAVMYKD